MPKEKRCTPERNFITGKSIKNEAEVFIASEEVVGNEAHDGITSLMYEAEFLVMNANKEILWSLVESRNEELKSYCQEESWMLIEHCPLDWREKNLAILSKRVPTGAEFLQILVLAFLWN